MSAITRSPLYSMSAIDSFDCAKGKPRHSETSWWNKDVDVAVCGKRVILGFRNRVGMRKIRRNIVRQEKILR